MAIPFLGFHFPGPKPVTCSHIPFHFSIPFLPIEQSIKVYYRIRIYKGFRLMESPNPQLTFKRKKTSSAVKKHTLPNKYKN
jgi:hypothetical protein